MSKEDFTLKKVRLDLKSPSTNGPERMSPLFLLHPLQNHLYINYLVPRCF